MGILSRMELQDGSLPPWPILWDQAGRWCWWNALKQINAQSRTPQSHWWGIDNFNAQKSPIVSPKISCRSTPDWSKIPFNANSIPYSHSSDIQSSWFFERRDTTSGGWISTARYINDSHQYWCLKRSLGEIHVKNSLKKPVLTFHTDLLAVLLGADSRDLMVTIGCELKKQWELLPSVNKCANTHLNGENKKWLAHSMAWARQQYVKGNPTSACHNSTVCLGD